ncbi:hypothetical protein D3P09_24600 [Paenibacillus pinisoli]|uniref:Uncharacterized protein n=1 Tax=Paenibacillus pinisoli TaxID=1276110 RepID=A0A3A6PAN2_9BACL|nr:hypothetical protein [Paenibacillus pinisoli]RJX37095.1 hypothetical protein D3P09_24600 [Paenibacillus pinisoli]
MLKWDSDVWGKLTGPYSSADNVPDLLQRLEQEYSQEVFDELFQEYLYHQNTIYTATYAAMPYLAQLACSTSDAEVRKELFINCGIIEASRDGGDESPFPASWAELAEDAGSSICTELYREYMEAMDKLRGLTKDVFAYAAAQQSMDETEKKYILIADAAYRGSYTIASMLMTFSEGDEYVAVCPSCEEEVYIWPGEDDAGILQAYEQDPVFHDGQEPQAIIPVTSFADEEVQALAERAEAIGEQTLARQLRYLAGDTTCPSCQENISVWSALLNTFAE